jgi:hypothetical protein
MDLGFEQIITLVALLIVGGVLFAIGYRAIFRPDSKDSHVLASSGDRWRDFMESNAPYWFAVALIAFAVALYLFKPQ